MGVHLACVNGHLEILKYLVEKDMKVNMKGEQGMSVIHLASREGHYEIV